MSLQTWNKLKAPPPDALSKITGGRLSGKTDIKPQWRYEIMTEIFGECGIGWKYEILKLWTELAPEGEIFAFAQINLYIVINNTWSDAIPGIGGSMLVEQETKGLHANDEAFKMAVTDALSVAMKMLGVGADIYRGFWDGSKYNRPIPIETKTPLEIQERRFAEHNRTREELLLALALFRPRMTPIKALSDIKVIEALDRYLLDPRTPAEVYLHFLNLLPPEGVDGVMQKIEEAGIILPPAAGRNYLEHLPELAKFYVEAA